MSRAYNGKAVHAVARGRSDRAIGGVCRDRSEMAAHASTRMTLAGALQIIEIFPSNSCGLVPTCIV